MRTLTEEQAHDVYDVLVRECGADDDRHGWSRASFVRYMTEPDGWVKEWRFMGTLGFGGKFRLNGNRDGFPYVDCYREDETPIRIVTIVRTNAALRALFPNGCEKEKR